MYQQRNNLQRWAILTVLLSISLSLLSACGADNTPTSAPPITATRATTSAAVTTASATTSASTASEVKTVAPVPNGNRTGVTDTEIKLGGIGPLNGPVAVVGTIQQTMKAYFTMINDQGGIYGRKINYILEDSSFDPVKTETAAKKLVEQDQVLALSGLILPTEKSNLLDYTDQKGIPVLPLANFANELYGAPHKLVFGSMPSTSLEGKFVVDYAAEQMGCKKLAVFYSDLQADSASLGTFLAEAQAKQLQVTAKLVAPTNPADFTSQAAMLQQTGTDFIYVLTAGRANPIGGLLNALDKLGYKPKVMLTYYSNGLDIYQEIGKAAEGMYSSWFTLRPDGDDIKSVQFREFTQKYMPGDWQPSLQQEGYIMAQIMVEALRRAGKDLTRESLVAAAESIVNWRDSYAFSITYGPINRLPISSFYVTQYKDGKIQKVSDWYTLK
jgi:branched-chain amino acid transport system substrate-binding protein